MKKIINSEKAAKPIGPYNQAVLANGMLFTSGQIALDAKTGALKTADLDTEVKQVMHNLECILEEAGLSFAHVIKTTIFLKDMDDFSQVNEIYGSFFETDFPVRETVEVSRLPKDVNVEISMIASA